MKRQAEQTIQTKLQHSNEPHEPSEDTLHRQVATLVKGLQRQETYGTELLPFRCRPRRLQKVPSVATSTSLFRFGEGKRWNLHAAHSFFLSNHNPCFTSEKLCQTTAKHLHTTATQSDKLSTLHMNSR